MQLSRLKSTLPFQALADETRYRAAHLLAKAGVPLTAGQISRALNLPANHLSRHLLLLEVAGITTTERRGRSHYICLVESDGSNAIRDAVIAAGQNGEILDLDIHRLATETGLRDDEAQ